MFFRENQYIFLTQPIHVVTVLIGQMVEVRRTIRIATDRRLGIRCQRSCLAIEFVQPRTTSLTRQHAASGIGAVLIHRPSDVVVIRCTPTTLFNRLISFHRVNTIPCVIG